MGITTAKIQAVERGITQSFDAGVRGVSTLYNSVCTIINSTRRDEKYGWVGDVPGMKEFIGDRQFDQLRGFNFEITNKPWEQSVGFERYDIEDDQYGHFSNVANTVGTRAARHPDELLVSLMAAAESTDCYDGQYFFDTDHSEGDSGTQSNDLTYTVASTSAVTPSEFLASFNAALIAMMQFKTDKGEYMMPRAITAGMMQNLHCIVPIQLMDAAQKAFGQNWMPQGSNGAAVDNVLLAKPMIHPVIGLGSSVKWQLLWKGGLIGPYIFQKRSPLTRQVKGALDIEEKLIKLMTEARYNMGYGLWQYAVQTTFST